ncbi:dethiobiotin synthase [Allomyces macrogynus ATCC 38327]|uniref:Dethiobiotin synthase n=1 Tax=Allomyces macrogynus (strain ATCC 38327) TaxID=578462 RepID=A0A0L0T001_ALLM3|nr:dethiobiotin synthase [Allomyces macrogynus ATCC 38327]|eukprot:KNE68118.1 dethiobiotin synthase [Allomyces macrogynus ATCC 38327]
MRHDHAAPTATTYPFLFHDTLKPVQLWGANTDVGKTLVSAALARTAAASLQSRVAYLKPIQTGFPVDSDERWVVDQMAPHAPTAQATLITYRDPVSPHLAAETENRVVPDTDVVRATADWLAQLVNPDGTVSADWALVETAGGVLSPVPSGALQADVFRTLRLPALLVGDSKLGGISTTLSAYESLVIRGYSVPAVVMLADSARKNETVVARNVDCPVVTIPRAPDRIAHDDVADRAALRAYFAAQETAAAASTVLDHVAQAHAAHVESLATLPRRASEVIWYPFTQHQGMPDPMAVDSAHGDNYLVARPESVEKNAATDTSSPAPLVGHPLYDGPASWWTQALGHSNPDLARTMAAAAGRYGHLIFPNVAHAPAVELAETLLNQIAPPGSDLSRVFYSDIGSTTTEVALKMALTWTALQMNVGAGTVPLGVVGVNGGYHGDTMGAMDACAPSDYNAKVPWYQARGVWVDPPAVRWTKNGHCWEVDIAGVAEQWGLDASVPRAPTSFATWDDLVDPARLESDPLARVYSRVIVSHLAKFAENGTYLGTVILEPLLLGAGGMLLVDPLFQRVLVREARGLGAFRHPAANSTWSGRVPVIYDEVFTGLWRLGAPLAAPWLEPPDAVCLAKCLTGGTLPLGATLATKELFDAFLGESKVDALLHGHSYTANPIACATALRAVRDLIPAANPRSVDWWTKDERVKRVVARLANALDVDGVVPVGTVLAVHLGGSRAAGYAVKEDRVERIVEYARERGVMLRPLGNVVYVMHAHTTSVDEVVRVAEVLADAIERSVAV